MRSEKGPVRIQGSGARRGARREGPGTGGSVPYSRAQSFPPSVPLLLCLIALLYTSASVPAYAQDAKQQLFERVFGGAVKLDPATVARVKAGKPGDQLFVDNNGDGKNDECWFIDTHRRHSEKLRPILVRVVDEDGDLDAYKGPDLDSDLYVADYLADGTADVVLDYQDNDGDNDLDEMGFYFFMTEHPFFGKSVLRVWWGRDDGDDNLLWYDEDYTYYQNRCQYRCHFSGDETFVAFGLTENSREWLSAYENPFLFYDPDGDECSEVVLRIEGKADAIRAIRYSFDADDDAYGRRTHDYDFSITATADEDKLVKIPPDMLESTKLRGIPTQGWLRRDKARPFVENAAWSKVLLTWDELNANTEQDFARDPHERWEGVIARASDKFPQVGGPPVSALNKRNELAAHPVGPLKLYYHPADKRLHLKGAVEGWLHVDYDFDGRVDAKYTWHDQNGDGYFDGRQIDVDADGRIDFVWHVRREDAQDVELSWEEIRKVYGRALEDALSKTDDFYPLKRISKSLPSAVRQVREFFQNELDSWVPETGLGHYIRRSRAGRRFYLELMCDRYLLEYRRRLGQTDAWAAIEGSYAAGHGLVAKQGIYYELGQPKSVDEQLPDGFTRQLFIVFDSEGKRKPERQPIVLPIGKLRAAAQDFNPKGCVVAYPTAIGPRIEPCQVDAEEISFIKEQSSPICCVYYSPGGSPERKWPFRTATAQDWVPPNIGWESNRGAYRAYWGQFDFFGKSTEQLIYPSIGAKSYHEETEWGIDALLVGKTSGIGGLTLYHKGKPYLVQNPAGNGSVRFEKRELAKGPIRSTVEIIASNILPEKPDASVRMVCTIYAEHQETEIRVQVSGLEGETLLAPGFMKLAREQVFSEPKEGLFGSWGFQDRLIGDIGMGLIYDPMAYREIKDLPDERRVVLSTIDGGMRYWIIGDWRRGRQYPVAPTVDNWKRELARLAADVRQEPTMYVAGTGTLVEVRSERRERR